MTQTKTGTPTKRPSIRQKMDAARKFKSAEFKSPEFVDDSDLELDDKPVETPVEIEVETPVEAVVAEIEKPKNAAFVWNYKRRDDTQSSTHASMIGGSFVVPLNERNRFYQQCYNEFVRWSNISPITPPTLFLTERYNGEYFRFFVDIDYKWSDSPPSVLETIELVTKSVSSMLNFMDDSCYGQSPLEVRPSERTDYKRHMVFPQVIMDPPKSLLFAQAVQKHLKNNSTLNIELDMKVYQKGSLRMLGSCKNTGLVSENEKETEFFYMPIDMTTGERKKTLTFEEFARHTILLDKETADRVQKFVEIEDGKVWLPADETYSDTLYVTAKYIHQTTSSTRTHSAIYAPQYTGPSKVAPDSMLYNSITTHYGKEMAKSAGTILEKYGSLIVQMNSKFCPFIGGEHKGNHPYIVLNKRGMRMKCYSTNDPRCIKGGELVNFVDLPAEVAEVIPKQIETESADGEVNTPANADITTIRGRAELLQPAFVADDLLTNTDAHNLFILSLSGTSKDVANCVRYQMAEDFVCVETDNQKWFHYREPLWRFREAKNDVYRMVSDSSAVYEQMIQTYHRNFTGKKEDLNSRIDSIKYTLRKVSDHGFACKAAKELASMCYDARFEQKLDNNSKLLGFNNGILDLTTFKFQPGGAPELLVSMTVGYDFPLKSDPKYREELERLMEDIQPEAENREYLQTLLGGLIEGGNIEELFHIFAGTGRNGKGVVQDLICLTLGSDGYDKENGEISKYSYVVPFEPQFLTCDRTTSSTPAPEIVNARLARVLIGSEPELGQKINSAFTKKLSGNDPIGGRLLFSNETVTYKPRFKIILLCNGIPVMGHNDAAVWKRARVVDFSITFVDNPVLPNERKIDIKLKAKIANDMNYRKEFMLMLLHWYKTLYLVKGLSNPPSSVLRATQVYQDESVLIAQYWRDSITIVPPSEHKHLCLRCIFEDFCFQEPTKTRNYTEEKMCADLGSIGVKINKAKTRCSNCPKSRHAVKNCRFSDERMRERGMAIEEDM